MNYGPRVTSLQSIGMLPSLGALCGTSMQPVVMERLRLQSGGGVIFGQPGDPYAESYQNLRALLETTMTTTNQVVEQTRRYVTEADRMVPITSLDDARAVPDIMHEPIVMYEPVRQLLVEGRIYGYDIKPENLPDEDVYGRLLENGTATLGTNEVLHWTWKTTDPIVSEEDLDAIEKTRGWFNDFLFEQMRDGGDWIDPTDSENTIRKQPVTSESDVVEEV